MASIVYDSGSLGVHLYNAFDLLMSQQNVLLNSIGILSGLQWNNNTIGRQIFHVMVGQ